jgi:hypothetical protein
MKVVINKCYGGFGLSPRAVARFAELKGRPCFFFVRDYKKGLHAPLTPIKAEDIDNGALMFHAYDVPNPDEVLPDQRNWNEMTLEDRKASNEAHDRHSIPTGREIDRADPDLIRVVEELGEEASGRFAELHIVEIPDGTAYSIDEYDGLEHVAETHRTWS